MERTVYRVSKGISAASRERITTGRINAVTDKLKEADTLINRLYDVAKRGAVGATVGTAAGAVLGPGVGTAVASALTKGGKTPAISAVDKLISSPEFLLAIQSGSKARKDNLINKIAAIFEGNNTTSKSSLSVKIKDPKSVNQRPFSDDYKNASGQAHAGPERLQADIEGRPLTGEFIAGRRYREGKDEGINAAESYVIPGKLGAETRPAGRTELKGDAGRYIRSRASDGSSKREILINQGLDNESSTRVLNHELSHLIEDLTYGGKIDVTGIKKELETIYHDLNSPGFGKGKWTPENEGYRGKDVEHELIAEAIRAYITDPNYIKTIAPKTAARIRKAVNENPNLNKVINFNSLTAPIAAGALGYGSISSPPYRCGKS